MGQGCGRLSPHGVIVVAPPAVVADCVAMRRLWFRIRYGFWCQHPYWTPWRMVDLGRRKVRWCRGCSKGEVV
jgi:hypothetical protein